MTAPRALVAPIACAALLCASTPSLAHGPSAPAAQVDLADPGLPEPVPLALLDAEPAPEAEVLPAPDVPGRVPAKQTGAIGKTVKIVLITAVVVTVLAVGLVALWLWDLTNDEI